VGEGKGVLSTRQEPGAAEALGSNRETPMNHPRGTRSSSSKKAMWPTAQLRCLCTSACSMGSKQEELVAADQVKNDDLIAVTET